MFMRFYVSISLLMLFVIACNPTNKNEANNTQLRDSLATTTQNSLSKQAVVSTWINEGEKQRLTIEKDGTCKLWYEFIDLTSEEFYENTCDGVWHIESNSLRISWYCKLPLKHKIPTRYTLQFRDNVQLLVHSDNNYLYNAFPDGNAPQKDSISPKNPQNILDYYKLLPSKYINYRDGDDEFLGYKANITTLDIDNGYIAYKNKTYASIPLFSCTIFKDVTGKYTLAVNNVHTNNNYSYREHATYFLQYDNGNWIDVSEKVLPKVPSNLFYKNAKLGAVAVEYTNSQHGVYDYCYLLPQKGTLLKVYLELPETQTKRAVTDTDFEKLQLKSMPVDLAWDKTTATFTIVK